MRLSLSRSIEYAVICFGIYGEMAAPAKPWENVAGGLNRQFIGLGPSFFDQMSRFMLQKFSC